MRSAGGAAFLGVIHGADLHTWTSERGSDRKRWDLRFSLTAGGTAWVTGQRGPAAFVLSRLGELHAGEERGKVFRGPAAEWKRAGISGFV